MRCTFCVCKFRKLTQTCTHTRTKSADKPRKSDEVITGTRQWANNSAPMKFFVPHKTKRTTIVVHAPEKPPKSVHRSSLSHPEAYLGRRDSMHSIFTGGVAKALAYQTKEKEEPS